MSSSPSHTQSLGKSQAQRTPRSPLDRPPLSTGFHLPHRVENSMFPLDMKPFYLPPEWHPQESVWLAWPSHEDLWQENLKPAQDEFVALCQAIHHAGAHIHLAVLNEARLKEAKERLQGLHLTLHQLPYGEIWFRDTLPLFGLNETQHSVKFRFQFNGWGQKYMLPGDEKIGDLIAEMTSGETYRSEMILEGGSIEVDGQGLLLTSEQCLLNPNRNPKMSREQIEFELQRTLAIQKVLWLKDGLLNDHTDGHIDTFARFVAPGEIAIMSASSSDDPNAQVFSQVHQDLSAMSTLNGTPIRVHQVISPGLVPDEDGEPMPASYLNFLICNQSVIVPTYGSINDAKALSQIAAIFPKHNVVGLSARAILSGGGAFHCITQQVPKRGLS